MKCLVTGGAGFIGSHLVDRLISEGHEVTVIDNFSTGRKSNIKQHLKNSKFGLFRESIDTVMEDNLLEDFDFNYIFHLAAIPSVRLSYLDPLKTNHTNVTNTVKMLEFARTQKNLKRFVFASSCAVYGDREVCADEDPLNPKSLYALSKSIGEQYCNMYSDLFHVPVTCCRFFNVYGERMRLDSEYGAVIPKFLQQAIEDQPFTLIGDGNKSRDFVYVKDIVNYLICWSGIGAVVIIDHNLPIVRNIGTGYCISLNILMKLISDIAILNGVDKSTYTVTELEETPGEVFSCRAADKQSTFSIEYFTEKLKSMYQYVKEELEKSEKRGSKKELVQMELFSEAETK